MCNTSFSTFRGMYTFMHLWRHSEDKSARISRKSLSRVWQVFNSYRARNSVMSLKSRKISKARKNGPTSSGNPSFDFQLQASKFSFMQLTLLASLNSPFFNLISPAINSSIPSFVWNARPFLSTALIRKDNTPILVEIMQALAKSWNNNQATNIGAIMSRISGAVKCCVGSMRRNGRMD